MSQPKGVVIIPFRKGSKGLKDKALCELGNHSLVYVTECHANRLSLPVVLYTDYEPFRDEPRVIKRPPVPDDQTTETALQVCLHELEHGQEEKYDYVCFMTVNTPVRRLEWMQECMNRFLNDWPAVSSSFIVEPMRKQLWKRNNNGIAGCGWYPNTSRKYDSRQSMPPTAYIEHTGVFLVTKAENIRQGKRIGYPVEPVVVTHPWVGLDIHTQADLDLANWLHERGEI